MGGAEMLFPFFYVGNLRNNPISRLQEFYG